MASLSPGRGRVRSAFIGAMLLTTLLLAMLLAAQAITTTRYHRSTAVGVLRDYARFAAGQFAARASQDLYYNVVNPVLEALAMGRSASGKPPPPDALTGRDESAGQALAAVIATFQWNRPRGSLELVERSTQNGLTQWLQDTLARDVTARAQEAPFYSIVREDWENPMLAVYTVERSGPRAGSMRGFVLALNDLVQFFRESAGRNPLLPPALTGGIRYDSLVSVRVTTPGGTDVFRSEPQYAATFSAWDRTGDYLGSLPVFAALRPDIAEGLIIGGLPRSRLPLLVGILLLTVGLIVAALLLLRREQELARLRAEFVSGVSHELRTPLAQIRMFAETLRLGRVRSEAERQRSLTIVDQEARRLTHLVENLLYFSRAEREPTRITRAHTSLDPLVREVAEGFAPLARVREMSVRVDSAGPLSADVDPDALRQILLNLLDNAVKYGPPGQVIVVGLAAFEGRALLTVSDQGPGIPPGQRHRVWDRFWRLERDRQSNVAGTGIGLAIVRELALLHGGMVSIEDVPGGGTRFVVQLGMAVETERSSPRPAGPAR